ncbi:hypothetical protein [Paraburkholderia strydomiana]
MPLNLNAVVNLVDIPAIAFGGENTAPLVPYVIEHRWRRLVLPMVQAGKPVEKYLAPVVVEWLDVGTGEVLCDEDARKDSRYQHPLRVSERCRQREYVLASLRPEIRALALFVLRFRNRRRGISPGVQTLVKWYAQYTNKRPENVRRNVQRLLDAKILEGDSLVGKLWQITDATSTHVQEDSEAEMRFAAMQMSTRAEVRRFRQ